MQFELKLPAKELVSGIFPLVSAADAMARARAEPGPSRRAAFFDFLEWLCSAAIAGELEICDELGWSGTFPEILDRTKDRGWYSAKHGDPNATKDELRAVDGLIVCTRLASLNAWAAPRGDEFYIDSPEQAAAPSGAPAVTPDDGDTMTPKDRRANHDITRERGCRRMILENWSTIESLCGPAANGRSVLRVLKRELLTDQPLPELKTVQNRLNDLRKEKFIP